jgi:hypothetical protein
MFCSLDDNATELICGTYSLRCRTLSDQHKLAVYIKIVRLYLEVRVGAHSRLLYSSQCYTMTDLTVSNEHLVLSPLLFMILRRANRAWRRRPSDGRRS